ncbi:MAG: molecular chaperone DnaJ [Synechococcaceae cyanobacterium]|nr:molecular chaperone DnaJ [Synechococcaceae cyanobacterium]
MADQAPGAVLPFASPGRGRSPRPDPGPAAGQGFAPGPEQRRSDRRRSPRKRRPAARLSAADWGPLGKHPDLDAIVARQRLGLPLSGRLAVAAVNQAWKRAAGEHHPDRGGAHDTMQAINGARDLLLGRHDD